MNDYNEIEISSFWDCVPVCESLNEPCPYENSNCRMWVDNDDSLNCVLVSINRNGEHTLREIAPLEGVSFVMIRHIEQKALKKFSKKHNL